MSDRSGDRDFSGQDRRAWQRPTVAALADMAGVSTATVDRVLNGRAGVREKTRQQVFAALARHEDRAHGSATHVEPMDVVVLSEAGTSFNEALTEAVLALDPAHDVFRCRIDCFRTADTDPNVFADLIAKNGRMASGIIVVAREHAAINRAIQEVQASGVPVVCMTTDLPRSNRTAYVGSDQASAGATAAYLMGRSLCDRQGEILLVISAPYRCQEDREVGFRRILRSEFKGLTVNERVSSNDEVELSYRIVRDYIAEHGAPVGVYNVAGGNRGIARALQHEGLLDRVVFIGHEMTHNTRALLESGAMAFAIGHDLDREIALSLDVIRRYRETGSAGPSPMTPVQIFTRHN